MKKKKPRTQEEQDELYLKTQDYNPDEKEVDNLYDEIKRIAESTLTKDELERLLEMLKTLA